MTRAVVANTATFPQRVFDADGPVPADFYAHGYRPCRMMQPLPERLRRQYRGRAKNVKVNVVESLGLARCYRIPGSPATMLFQNGRIVANFGAMRFGRESTAAADRVTDRMTDRLTD